MGVNKKLRRTAIAGAIIFIIGLIMAFIGFPMIVDDQIHRQVRLKNGSDAFGRWQELPVAIGFNVYLFNITNWEEVTFQGAYPKVIEHGPYIYQQFRKKTNITYDQTDDSLTYTQYMHFEFDDEASGERNEDEIVTLLNAPLNTIFQVANRYFPGILMEYLINDYWKDLFPDALGDSMFIKVRVGDILFDGYSFCNPKNWRGTSGIICIFAALLDLPFLELQDDYSIKFAFFFFKQDKHDGIFTINAGVDDVSKIGQITQWNGNAYNTIWGDRMSRCNKIVGTDGTMYPPNLNKDDLMVFSTEICRSAATEYVGDVVMNGVNLQKRILSWNTLADPAEYPENNCYCTKNERDLFGNKKCLPNGFSDISPCYIAPLIASYPHFLKGDKDYVKTVEGLTPDEEKHQTVFYVDPVTGVPMSGHIRLQFNMILRPIPGVEVTKDITPNICPVAWIDMGVILPDDLIGLFKTLLDLAVVAVDVIKWLIVAIGGCMFLICGGLYIYRSRQQSVIET